MKTYNKTWKHRVVGDVSTDWTQFSKRVYINADLKTVYNAWTKSGELEKWFLSKATFYEKDSKEILPSKNVISESVYRWNWFAQNYRIKQPRTTY